MEKLFKFDEKSLKWTVVSRNPGMFFKHKADAVKFIDHLIEKKLGTLPLTKLLGQLKSAKSSRDITAFMSYEATNPGNIPKPKSSGS